MLQKFYNLLMVFAICITGFTFYKRYELYKISKEELVLVKEIHTLKEKKYLLEIELVYLTSTERILSIIDKNPDLLDGKRQLEISQINTHEQFRKIAMKKANLNRQVAKKYEKSFIY